MKRSYTHHGKFIPVGAYYTIQIYSSNNKTEIQRTYFTIQDAFSSVGGLLQFLIVVFYAQYGGYNRFKLNKHISLKVILGKASILPQEYNIGLNYSKLTQARIQCCFCFKYKQDPVKNFQMEIMENCENILSEKMDLANYLHDAMDFHAMRQLLMKSRHKILIPVLIINLSKNKKKDSKGYKSSFYRNIHERTDQPVFTVEDAIIQLKKGLSATNFLEQRMDEFFLTHLPKNILEIDKPKLNENDKIGIMKLERYKKHKDAFKSHGDLFKNIDSNILVENGNLDSEKKLHVYMTNNKVNPITHQEEFIIKRNTNIKSLVELDKRPYNQKIFEDLRNKNDKNKDVIYSNIKKNNSYKQESSKSVGFQKRDNIGFGSRSILPQ